MEKKVETTRGFIGFEGMETTIMSINGLHRDYYKDPFLHS